jgi:hypothetical protein
MATIAVNVRRRDEAHDLDADLRRARVLAKLLDAQFSVGGFRFGLDALIGLVPGMGDVVMSAVALYPVYLVRKHKLSQRYARKMLVNVAIDFAGGTVPILGDLFDAYFKANLKNLALLERAVAEGNGAR